MIKISDALRGLVEDNSFLQYGLQHKLLNLSQVARYLKPLIAARTKKEVQDSALLMGLSRLQTVIAKEKKVKEKEFEIDNISVQSNLAIITLEKNRDAHKRINSFYSKVNNIGAYVSVTEGLSEITVIFDRKYEAYFMEALPSKPIYKNSNISAISVRFNERYLKTRGFIFAILQSIVFQGINIIEISSTTTELIFYLESGDIQLAFDTLYHKFRAKKLSE